MAMSPDKPRLGFNRAALRRSIGIVRSFEPPSVDAEFLVAVERVAEIGRKSVFLDGLKWRGAHPPIRVAGGGVVGERLIK